MTLGDDVKDELDEFDHRALIQIDPPGALMEGAASVERVMALGERKKELLRACVLTMHRFEAARDARDAGAMRAQAEALVKASDALAIVVKQEASMRHVVATALLRDLQQALDLSRQGEGPPALERIPRETLAIALEAAGAGDGAASVADPLSWQDVRRLVETLQQGLAVHELVREELRQAQASSPWPPAPTAPVVEELRRHARDLLETTRRTRVRLGPEHAGSKAQRWWLVPHGAAPTFPMPPGASGPELEAAPGTYDLYVRQDGGGWTSPVEVATCVLEGITVRAGKTTLVQPRSGIRVVPARELPPPATWLVTGANGRMFCIWAAHKEADAIAWLPPGKYDVHWAQSPTHRARPYLAGKDVKVERDVVTLAIPAGGVELRLAEWASPIDPTHGGWSLVSPGPPENVVGHAKAPGTLHVPPGRYRLVLAHDYEHNFKPLVVREELRVEEGAPMRVDLQEGVRLLTPEWVPKRDPTHGLWAATPAGRKPPAWVNWTRTQPTLLLPPGTYDVYWIQGYHHQSRPLLLAEKVSVEQGRLVELHARTGIALEPAPEGLALDPTHGWWGIVPADAPTSAPPIHWANQLATPLLAPPGTYDVLIKPNYHAPPARHVSRIQLSQNDGLKKLSLAKPEGAQ